MTLSPESDSSLETFIKAVSEKKASDIVSLDMRELISIADTFIICTGNSNRHVTAIAESIHFNLKQQGIKPLRMEGLKEGHWVIIDYGDVVIHIFYEPVRKFYDIESLWADAKKTFY